MTSTPLLTAHDLGHAYGSTTVLDGISLTVEAGTSLALTGILTPDAGTIDYAAPTGRVRELAQVALARLGLDGAGPRRPGQLSGGQQQRVAIARALVTCPAIYFADEPTEALDSATAAAVMDTLQSLQRETGAALVLVTHDSVIADRCERVVEVRDGRLIAPTSSRGAA